MPQVLENETRSSLIVKVLIGAPVAIGMLVLAGSMIWLSVLFLNGTKDLPSAHIILASWTVDVAPVLVVIVTAILVLIPFLFGGIMAVITFGSFRDLLSGTVTFTGIVTRKDRSNPGPPVESDVTHFEVRIDNESYEVTRRNYYRLKRGDAVRVEWWPRSETIKSITVIRHVNPWPRFSTMT